MGWFDEQIKERTLRDEETLSDALEEISSIITRTRPDPGVLHRVEEQEESITDALHHIFRYYRVKPGDLTHDVKGLEDQLEHICRPHGMMRRTVKLEKGWYRDSVGAMLGFRKDGRAVALIPGRISGYVCYDRAGGKPIRLSKKQRVTWRIGPSASTSLSP